MREALDRGDESAIRVDASLISQASARTEHLRLSSEAAHRDGPLTAAAMRSRASMVTAVSASGPAMAVSTSCSLSQSAIRSSRSAC